MQSIITAENLRFLDLLRFPPIAVERESVTFIAGKRRGQIHAASLSTKPSRAAGNDPLRGPGRSGMDPSPAAAGAAAGQNFFCSTYHPRQLPAFSNTGATLHRRGKDALHPALCRLEMPLTARCQPLSGGERQRVFWRTTFDGPKV
jgi:hypothetical protein